MITRQKLAITGNHAVAYAAKMARVKVVSAYPITPQTSIVEKLSEMIEKGELDARMIRVESEHSALAAAFGAAIAGARTFTATSSHGLLYMHEWVHWVSRTRIPLVMAIVTRTIGPPWNIWPDHTDYIDQRDTGWIMSFGMDNQEVFDLTLQAFKISEDPRVFLPVMVGLEGFILGGTVMPVELPDQKEVDEWLGPRRQPYIADGSTPFSVGNLSYPEDTEEIFMDIQKSMQESKKAIIEIDKEYGKMTGREYGGLYHCYNCGKAKYHVVIMGAWSGDALEAIESLNNEGYNIGMLRIRYFRPFPGKEIVEELRNSKGIIVFDRSISFGSTGQIYSEIATAFTQQQKSPPIIKNIIAGIGGVNITYRDFYHLVKNTIFEFENNINEKEMIYWYHKGR